LRQVGEETIYCPHDRREKEVSHCSLAVPFADDYKQSL
jgi:hypothetical protein